MSAPSTQPKASLILAIATSFAVAATLIVNTLSNIIPPGGLNVGQIANTQLQNLLVLPANYAFSIWGLIYLGLIAYCVYQWRQRLVPLVRRVDALLIVACLAQVVWIYLFSLQFFGWSIIAMACILGPLMLIYRQIQSDRTFRPSRWSMRIPFSIYLAWIAVATIVNVAAALYAASWDRWGLNPETWAIALILVGTVLAAIALWQYRDVAFGSVFVWAYVAIALRHVETTSVSWTAAIAAGAIVILIAVQWQRTTAKTLE